VGQGQESADSIFDLIYVDHARVAVFLSQFGRFGNLTDQTRSVRETYQKTLSGGIEATVRASRETEQSAVEELQRHFDPQWLLPFTLLDQLEERRLISRDITKASLGQFVLCSGSLSILDFSILKKIWELPAIDVFPIFSSSGRVRNPGIIEPRGGAGCR
jgi:hypothetical protein